MPKISVIVPVYKVEEYINRCVNSILEQTFEDFELILVDDGSPDNCGKICDDYAEKDKRVHVIHQQNGGLSAARNAGIDWSFENSDSEWITFVDSDDWLRKDALEMMYNAVKEQNTNICIAQFFFADETFVEGNYDYAEPQKLELEKIYNRFTQDINLISACSKLYKKEQWINIRFPVGKLNEDRFTTHKLLFQNKYVSILPVQLYYYYNRSDSIMHKWTPERLDDLEAVKEQLKYFKEKNLKDAREKAMYDHILLLRQFVKALNQIYPEYKEYRIKIKFELKKVVIKYWIMHDISIKKDRSIFDNVFPGIMSFVWRLNNIRHKIFNLGKKEENKNDT